MDVQQPKEVTVNYRDVTLAPDDVEWDTISVWEAARYPDKFQEFVDTRGVEESIRHFHKAHRAIANKMTRHHVTTGSEFPEARQWIYAARIFKRARKRVTHLYRDKYGQEMTTELQQNLNARYPKVGIHNDGY